MTASRSRGDQSNDAAIVPLIAAIEVLAVSTPLKECSALNMGSFGLVARTRWPHFWEVHLAIRDMPGRIRDDGGIRLAVWRKAFDDLQHPTVDPAMRPGDREKQFIKATE